MMALRMVEHARAMRHRAALRIGRRVIEPRDSRMGYGTCTHRAGLQRDVQGGTGESIILLNFCRLPKHDNLSMG